MTSIDSAERFDAQLSAALATYAAEARADADVSTVARLAIQAGSARSHRGIRDRSLPWVALRWIAVAAIVVAGTTAAVLVMGSKQTSLVIADPSPSGAQPSPTNPMTSTAPISPDESVPVPDELAGRWYGEFEDEGRSISIPYSVDFGSSLLIRQTTPVARFGRAVGFERLMDTPSQTLFRVFLAAPPPCGDGSYIVSLVGAYVHFSGADACEERAAILQRVVWEDPSAIPTDAPGLVEGQRYAAEGFTEPFQFVAANLDPSYGEPRAVLFAIGVYQLVNRPSSWRLQFLDDVPVWSRPCDVTSRSLPDVPETMAGVVDWLRGTEGLLAGEPVELTVDGRTAVRFDLDWENGCIPYNQFRPNLVAGYRSWSTEPQVRVYAIPTGDDIVLAVLSSDMGSLAPVLLNTDAFVESITFD